jgi:hypothetical protein
MKYFKVTLIGLLIIIVAAIGLTTYQYNTFKPLEVTHKINSDNLKYFQESYNDCRKGFLAEAHEIKGLYNDVNISNIKIESKVDHDLTIDYCYIPAQKKSKRLFILTSAIHGVEGYVGSAVQQMFLKELIKEVNLDNLGLLVIHGINPYGFKYKRRVTENNIDLNRNSSTDSTLYESTNSGYSDMSSMLNPTKKVNMKSAENVFFKLKAIYKIIRYSMPKLRQAILQGQYQYKNGVYFGGKEIEPSIRAITPIIKSIAQNYDLVFSIDLHTGYGKRGTLHLFPNPIEDKMKKTNLENIFSGNHIDGGGEDDFYTVTGDFCTYIGQIIPKKYYLTMTFEFGTLDSQVTNGAIKSLHNVILENQGVHFGYKSEENKKIVKRRFLEGYYPSSKSWRSKAIMDAKKTLIQAVKNYQKIDN